MKMRLLFNYSSPPPFTNEQYIFACTYFAFHLLGAVFNVALLYCLVKNIKVVKKNPHMLLILNLTLADTFFMHIGFARYLPKLIYSSFSLGVVGCQFEGVSITMGAVGSVFALAWVALERMLTVVRESPKDMYIWKVLIVVGWLTTLFFSSLPLCFEYGYVLQPSGVFCHYDWETNERKKLMYAMVIGIVCTQVLANGVMYGLVALKIKRIQSSHAKKGMKKIRRASPLQGAAQLDPEMFRQVEIWKESKLHIVPSTIRPLSTELFPPPLLASSTSSSSSSTSSSSGSLPLPSAKGSDSINFRVRKWERVIYMKSVALALCFIVCWSPYMISAMLRMAHYEVHPSTDFWTSLLAIVNSCLNPILALTMDPKIAKFARDLFVGCSYSRSPSINKRNIANMSPWNQGSSASTTNHF